MLCKRSPTMFLMASFLVGEPKLIIWLCVCVCDVWYVLCPLDGCDALMADHKLTVQSQSVCTVHLYTSHGHNIVLNRAEILAWASTLHETPNMAISWPTFLFSSHRGEGLNLLKFFFIKVISIKYSGKLEKSQLLESTKITEGLRIR